MSALLASSSPRDTLDVLSAFGPTVAAGAAVVATCVAAWVAWRVGQDGAAATREAAAATKAFTELTRSTARPRITVRKGFAPGSDGVSTNWTVTIVNNGPTRAEVRKLEVMVNGEPCAPAALTDPRAFWSNIIAQLGLSAVEFIEPVPRTFGPLFVLGGDRDMSVFSVISREPIDRLKAASDRLTFRLTYRSAWGDEYTFDGLKPIGEAEAGP